MFESLNLDRFLSVQDSIYPTVLDELRSGQRRNDWMWFIFPTLRGLGASPLALYFGLNSLDEAAAYLEHPILGPRLEECTRLVSCIETNTAFQIFGSPEDQTFHASMTLFRCASKEPELFNAVMRKFFDGELDPLTLAMLR